MCALCLPLDFDFCRSSFQEKDQRLQGMAEDLKTQIEDLEDELDKARKSEARYTDLYLSFLFDFIC